MSTDAQLIWLDPGVTTGICVVQIDPEWLRGTKTYHPGWNGLQAATTHSAHLQVGRHGRNDLNLALEDLMPTSAGFSPLREVLTQAPCGGAPAEETTVHEIGNVLACQAMLDDWPDAAWGYEGFEVRQIDTSIDFLSPARIGLAITMSEMVSEYPRMPFVQSSSMAKNTLTDDRLKQAGLYVPGYKHANDAARHCAAFFRRARANAQLRAAAWPQLFTDGN